LNTCFDNALDIDTLFHGAAVVVKRVNRERREKPGARLGKSLPPPRSTQ
jgi:hypothetical protein